ncbi:MAG TPA: peptidylprolyl isomerase [Verrucomicrobiota bacterium]|nr:peptidylprolyl isomerase [Verrucomicrobiota bacterium]HNU49326.1 peptidylprolyl isomerase [Verrucomicrobiota bacterium]
MNRYWLVTVSVLTAGVLGLQTQAADPKADAKPGAAAEVAVIKTSKGDMVVEFWPDVAPKTVENFKTLARKGFYDGTAFHRIVKGFMIQGGDPLTKDPGAADRYGTGGPGHTIKAEFNARKHVRGVLSMARSASPDSAGSQFFICLDDAAFLDGKYTAFGKLRSGEDVLLKIGETPTQPNRFGNENSVPTERVGVESIKIVPANSIK